MKEFIFDRLVNKENICNLEKEKTLLMKLALNKENVVVYAPRNYGKTSLIKKVIIPEYRDKTKNPFVVFVDLMGVTSLASISSRLQLSIEKELSTVSTGKSVWENLKGVFGSFNPNIEMDMQGNTSISFNINTEIPKKTFNTLFGSLGELSKKYDVLLILDEFQDITFVEESEALFRESFQQLNIPIILLGSKKHLLQNIFIDSNKPLSNWGKDVVIPPIKYETYHAYIQERFKQKKLSITLDESIYLQDKLNRIPENINIICNELLENNKGIDICRVQIETAIKDILFYRQGRFEEFMKTLSDVEEQILIRIAKEGCVSSPQSKQFVSKTTVTPRTISKTISKLTDDGMVDITKEGYVVSDVLLRLYLEAFR